MTMPRTDRARAAVVAILLTTCAWALTPAYAQAPDVELEDLASFPRETLTIESTGRRHSIEAWIAGTPARQQQGLMFVASLAPGTGMLFVEDEPRPKSMWMKNTLIPLDMLFIDERGRIVRIVARTTPHSLASVRSGAPVKAVLEIAGGEAARLGIRNGDFVRHRAFGPAAEPALQSPQQ